MSCLAQGDSILFRFRFRFRQTQKYRNTEIHKNTNTPIHKYRKTPLRNYTNTQTHKHTMFIYHFSEQRKCFVSKRKSQSGTGTHLSEQRRRCSAHGRRAAHVPKLWYQHFVAYVPVTQQAEKRHCRRGPCDHLIRIQFLPSFAGRKKSGSVRQSRGMSCKAG